MHPWFTLQILALLAIANGTPVMVNSVLGSCLAFPLDGGVRFFDEQPLFGSSKTLRGILAAALMTTAGAAVLGMNWEIGLAIGILAMGGDLFSSFAKRRLHLVAGDRATGLDQVPESLFPLLGCRYVLGLTALDITIVVVGFFVGEVLISILLYKFHLRERPY